jgi:hypothetical protein
VFIVLRDGFYYELYSNREIRLRVEKPTDIAVRLGCPISEIILIQDTTRSDATAVITFEGGGGCVMTSQDDIRTTTNLWPGDKDAALEHGGESVVLAELDF